MTTEYIAVDPDPSDRCDHEHLVVFTGSTVPIVVATCPNLYWADQVARQMNLKPGDFAGPATSIFQYFQDPPV